MKAFFKVAVLKCWILLNMGPRVVTNFFVGISQFWCYDQDILCGYYFAEGNFSKNFLGLRNFWRAISRGALLKICVFWWFSTENHQYCLRNLLLIEISMGPKFSKNEKYTIWASFCTLNQVSNSNTRKCRLGRNLRILTFSAHLFQVDRSNVCVLKISKCANFDRDDIYKCLSYWHDSKMR